jgi:glutathione S-transferase
MEEISLQDPHFRSYAIAAALMILKAVGMSWLTVVRMLRAQAGFRAPEDLRASILNPAPSASQLGTHEHVDRIRRIQLNDLESLPYFLVAGFLYLLTAPPLWLAQALLYGFVLSRLVHFVAYLTAQSHEVRAAFWTIGSLILIYMTGQTLAVALLA